MPCDAIVPHTVLFRNKFLLHINRRFCGSVLSQFQISKILHKSLNEVQPKTDKAEHFNLVFFVKTSF